MRENERFLSRRSFLAGTGVLVGGVGLSTAAACLAPKSALAEDQASSANTVPESVQPIDPVEPPAQWDGTANVIVVGTGGSGGAAIVSALEAGASVIALEKNSIWGGHMQFSTGRGLPGATPAETFASEISAPYPYAEKDPLIARHIAEVINTDFEWLAGMLAEADITITTGMNFPFVALCAPSDYVEPANTTKLEEMAWHQWFPFNAKGYSIAFQKKANALGADIHYSTAVTALVLENDKVVGVRASDQEGTELFFKGSVVLCSGGYSANDDLLHHYLTTRKYKSFNKYAGLPSATGDGIRMAQGVNAALIAMDDVEIWHGGVMDPEYRSGPASFYHPANQLSRIAGLCVNKLGNRYMDESSIQGDLFGYLGKIRSQQLDNTSFTILDATTTKAQEVFDTFHPIVCEVPTPWFDKEISSQLERGIIVKADTIEELADKLEIDKETFTQTVSRYNEICSTGEDTDFFKPPIYLHPIKQAPFYGIKEQGGQLINTWGGLKTNYSGQVLDEQWQPIKGLYAAGETCAYGGELHRVMSAGRWSGAAAAKDAISS